MPPREVPTSLDADWQLRLAAFARLRALRDRHGADIATAGELAEGFEFEGERIRLSSPRQGIWKPRQANAALTIVSAPPHPGRPAPYDAHVDETSGFYLYRYERTDPQLASNRVVRRAMELHRPLIYLIGLDKGLYQVVHPVYVTADSPFSSIPVSSAPSLDHFRDSDQRDRRVEHVGMPRGPEPTRLVLRNEKLHVAREALGILRHESRPVQGSSADG
jgi:hypothetical protein